MDKSHPYATKTKVQACSGCWTQWSRCRFDWGSHIIECWRSTEMLGRFVSGKSLLVRFHKQPLVMAVMYQCTLEAFFPPMYCGSSSTSTARCSINSHSITQNHLSTVHSSPFAKPVYAWMWINWFYVVRAVFVLHENCSCGNLEVISRTTSLSLYLQIKHIVILTWLL